MGKYWVMNFKRDVGMVCSPNNDMVKKPNDTEKSRKNSRAGGRGNMINRISGKKISNTKRINQIFAYKDFFKMPFLSIRL